MGLDILVSAKQDGTLPEQTAKCLQVRDVLAPTTARAQAWADMNADYVQRIRQQRSEAEDPQKFDALYVPETAEDVHALAAVSGFFVNAFSFRGKCVAYIDGLPAQLREALYEDHTPESLAQLAESVEDARRCLRDNEDRALAEAFVQWARYWSSNGHGVKAWY